MPGTLAVAHEGVVLIQHPFFFFLLFLFSLPPWRRPGRTKSSALTEKAEEKRESFPFPLSLPSFSSCGTKMKESGILFFFFFSLPPLPPACIHSRSTRQGNTLTGEGAFFFLFLLAVALRSIGRDASDGRRSAATRYAFFFLSFLPPLPASFCFGKGSRFVIATQGKVPLFFFFFLFFLLAPWCLAGKSEEKTRGRGFFSLLPSPFFALDDPVRGQSDFFFSPPFLSVPRRQADCRRYPRRRSE